jgi:hypothetical protein
MRIRSPSAAKARRMCGSLTARNEGFLVGEGDVLARLDGLDGGEESSAADDARNDGVGIAKSGHLGDALFTIHKFRHGSVPAGERVAQARQAGTVANGDDLGLVLFDLLCEQLDVPSGRQAHDFEEILERTLLTCAQ